LPTPVTERLDATGTLPPVTAPANKTTTIPSLEEATTVVWGLLFLTFEQNLLDQLVSHMQCDKINS